MQKGLWNFTDNSGTFEFPGADKIKTLYLPLCNEKIKSSITPTFHGDIKTGNNSFLLTPASRVDLSNSKSSRNFWLYLGKDSAWSATGVSKDLKALEGDKVNLKAGLLWQVVSRENKKIGLKAEILSFVPVSEPVEIMQVRITNISGRKIKFIPTAAIPVYARSANSIRDHRHVTSLLNRLTLNKFGVIVHPTLIFDEAGHWFNKNNYFVLGCDGDSKSPEYIYPTQEMFCGESGDLEAPEAIFKNLPPDGSPVQGKEAMGALRFREITLPAGKNISYILVMGILDKKMDIHNTFRKFNSPVKVEAAFEETKKFWIDKSEHFKISTGEQDFDNWFRWVSIQPALRKIFGCSFLPDFDYGKGGRGWRDLWQDCLGLLLSEPAKVRNLLINNFSGIRIDGSNATIIGNNPGEFIADRNNVSRVWMDHGIWPLLTLDLYMHETGDTKILFEQAAYFRDNQLCRSREIDRSWDSSRGKKLEDASGKAYKGTLLEHLLLQNLVQFYNVGAHNHIRLEGADWNDGLDMAVEFGESVAFTAMYAQNLKRLSEILLKTGENKISIAKELAVLFKKTDNNSIKAKQRILEEYFAQTKTNISGAKIEISVAALAKDLRKKSDWISAHIRKAEWLKVGFFNGYYDNKERRVEGRIGSLLRMCLASQVFPIMSGVSDDRQVARAFRSIEKHLLDKELGGFHLNTDFKQEQHDLGRAFSFIYGDKENGAFFNHMIVMLAFGLYKRGFVNEGWKVISSIYKMALDPKAKVYPCLPEYFDAQGRGMYGYLTGSASWFVLTLFTEVFGIKGKDGNLCIEPKLCKEQFKNSGSVTINRVFAGRKFEITFLNPKRLSFGEYTIARVIFNGDSQLKQGSNFFVFPRGRLLRLPPDQVNKIEITLG